MTGGVIDKMRGSAVSSGLREAGQLLLVLCSVVQEESRSCRRRVETLRVLNRVTELPGPHGQRAVSQV